MQDDRSDGGRPVRPAASALLDQAGAASASARATMTAVAAIEGTPIRHVIPGPVMQALIHRMRTRATGGQLTLCPHLSYTSPEPAFWCAWAPGRVRCTSCAHAASMRIKGTREDRVCDHCRATVPKIHADMAMLPPVVVDLPPWPPRCIPPIALMAGLCPACQREDGSP